MEEQAEEALHWLLGFADYERNPLGHEFNLDRPRRLLSLLGDPQTSYRSVVIAGTNGKGSTARMVQALLAALGYRVGLYTQPHLHRFAERIRVGEELIGDGALAAGVELLKPAVSRLHRDHRELGRLTSYEIATALALSHFAEERVDWAVLEVGLGGRLDAVNAVESSVAVITPIGLDHMQVLGGTIEQIAFEKAGIIRRRTPVVVAPQPPEALHVLRTVSAERQADMRLVDEARAAWVQAYRFGRGAGMDEMRDAPFVRFDVANLAEGICLGLGGQYQVVNALTALEALDAVGLELTGDQVRESLRRVRWPARLEVGAARPTVILDGAHNGPAAEQLASAIRAHFDWRQLGLVFGTSADKDLPGVLAPLAPLADRIVCTRSSNPRALPVEQVAACAAELGLKAEVAPDVPSAVQSAREGASPEDLILATGSLFVAAEAREWLGHQLA